MSTAMRLSLVVLALTSLISPAPLSARDYNRAEGQVLRVDASAKKIVIRTEQGSQLQCTFTGETRVVGSAEQITSLPLLTPVTVHYAKEQLEFVATEIEVHAQPY
jgi:hypothetical protein